MISDLNRKRRRWVWFDAIFRMETRVIDLKNVDDCVYICEAKMQNWCGCHRHNFNFDWFKTMIPWPSSSLSFQKFELCWQWSSAKTDQELARTSFSTRWFERFVFFSFSFLVLNWVEDRFISGGSICLHCCLFLAFFLDEPSRPAPAKKSMLGSIFSKMKLHSAGKSTTFFPINYLRGQKYKQKSYRAHRPGRIFRWRRCDCRTEIQKIRSVCIPTTTIQQLSVQR